MRKPYELSALLFAGVVTLFLSSAVAARSLPEFTELVEKFGPAVVNISTGDVQCQIDQSSVRFALDFIVSEEHIGFEVEK